jgi:hypothetical protein
VALPATVDLECYRGDTWAQSFRLSADGNPVDLAGATVACWARKSELVEHLAVTVGPDPGVVTIAMTNGGISPGAWAYDLEVTDATLTVKTWVRGRLIVERDVTHGD